MSSTTTVVETVANPSFEAIHKLTRDLKKAAVTLTRTEARFLVDNYYTMQDNRIRTGGQIREMESIKEPHEVLKWFNTQDELLENEVKRALDSYSNGFVLGRWARSLYGIGPVIAAGLLAHLDIEKAKGAGAFWRFAGLDPTSEWKKGEKRPWNAALKVLCWKAGESFVKTSGREGDIYGHLLIAKKDLLTSQNEALMFKNAAAEVLVRVPKHAQASIYKTGKLPPGHIFSRAKRYAVKLFLAHYFEVSWWLKYNCAPPMPFIFTDQAKALGLDHSHWLHAPNFPMAENLPEGLPKLP